jgi:hypothetical protein
MKERKSTPITPVVYFTDEFSYVLIRDVPVELRDAFIKFMYGQTTPMVCDEHEGEFKDAVYSWDYVNFLNRLLGRPSFID